MGEGTQSLVGNDVPNRELGKREGTHYRGPLENPESMKKEARQHIDSMRVYLPYQFDISTMYGFINDVIDQNYLPRNNKKSF